MQKTGGSAGCAVAGRVAAADPSLKVLLIESGRNNYMNPAVLTPAMYLTHMLPDSESTIFYATNTAEQLAGRGIVIPAGGILGGGSSTNAMMYVNCRFRLTLRNRRSPCAGSDTRDERYTRAQRSDYDSWNTKGWSTDEVLPYLKKVSQTSPLSPFSSPLNNSLTH